MQSIEWSPSGFGLARLREGQVAISRARLAHLRDDRGAESLARDALRILRAAIDNLDDLPEQLDAHFSLDHAGLWVRKTFGCWLAQDEKGYWRTCPVDLGHQRWGMSPGMTNVVRTCMVCGRDPRACRHVAGRTYNAPALRIDGYCNVCGTENPCAHAAGDIHTIVCTRHINSAEVQEISLVRRPANTAARIGSIGVSTKELEVSLGADGWLPGMPVSCDRCLHPCNGLLELSEPTNAASVDPAA